MPPTEFKLSKHNGVTRRLVFPERPVWKTLSARISELYSIPADLVAVAYVDSDGDQVTLNTEEELSHFLTSSQGVIKLSVQDLSSLRSQASSATLSDTPFFQTPVGLEPPLEEEEWHIPNWEGMFPPPKSLAPRAFTRIAEDQNSDTEDSDTEMPYNPMSTSETTETLVPITVDKGKAKATTVEDVDESVASSVISGDAPPKPPIHVYDVSGIQRGDVDMLRVPTPALAESTPKTPLNEVDKQGEDQQMSNLQDSADDPPLPSIESQSLPSLSNDIANLVTSLGTVLSSHPEVSDGLHNILRNAASGTYWRAHREALSKAAEEISQASESAMRDISVSEVDAGRTIWEAMDTFLRSLSQATGIPTVSTTSTQREGATEPTPAPSPHPDPMPSAAPTVQTEDNSKTNQDQTTSTAPVMPEVESESPQVEPPKEKQQTFPVRPTEWQSSSRPFPHPFTSFVPPPPPHNIYPNFPFFPARPPPSSAVPPVFPPQHIVPPLPPLHLPPHMMPPPPPPPPANVSYQRSFSNLNRSFSVNSPPSSRAPQVAEMKAKVQAAKSMYRAEKARYLQEREQARHQRLRGRRHGGAIQSEMDDSKPFEDLQSLLDASVVSVEQNVGNASEPLLSYQSTPRRHESVIEDFRSRAVKRICKQLADMGFTEYQHPGLADRVVSRLPAKGTITKDIEDGIVTNLLEELLPLSSPGPAASGSGSGLA